MSVPQNLRREARVEARVGVVLYRGKAALPLETSDVSFRGVFLCTSDPPALRSLVRLRVVLPARTIEAHAMVVHVAAADEGEGREAGVGLQFWGLAGPDRTAWDDFVRDLVHARRAMARRASGVHGAHPALSEPATPSGVRMVAAELDLPASTPTPDELLGTRDRTGSKS